MKMINKLKKGYSNFLYALDKHTLLIVISLTTSLILSPFLKNKKMIITINQYLEDNLTLVIIIGLIFLLLIRNGSSKIKQMIIKQTSEISQMEIEQKDLDNQIDLHSLKIWNNTKVNQTELLSIKRKHENLSKKIMQQKLIVKKNTEKSIIFTAVNVVLVEVILLVFFLLFAKDSINSYTLLIFLTSIISFLWTIIISSYKLIIIILKETFPDSNDRTTIVIAFFGTIISLISLFK